jgi:hypothetical protein
MTKIVYSSDYEYLATYMNILNLILIYEVDNFRSFHFGRIWILVEEDDFSIKVCLKICRAYYTIVCTTLNSGHQNLR